jgi:predicted nuclease with TOPRIM domain
MRSHLRKMEGDLEQMNKRQEDVRGEKARLEEVGNELKREKDRVDRERELLFNKQNVHSKFSTKARI